MLQDGAATRSVRDGAARSVQMVEGLYEIVRDWHRGTRCCEIGAKCCEIGTRCCGDWCETWCESIARDAARSVRDGVRSLRSVRDGATRSVQVARSRRGLHEMVRGQHEMLRDEIGARMPDAVRLVRDAAAIGARCAR